MYTCIWESRCRILSANTRIWGYRFTFAQATVMHHISRLTDMEFRNRDSTTVPMCLLNHCTRPLTIPTHDLCIHLSEVLYAMSLTPRYSTRPLTIPHTTCESIYQRCYMRCPLHQSIPQLNRLHMETWGSVFNYID